MSRVAIVGGGIAGLAALHELVSSGHENVVLLESSEKLGGKIHTTEFSGRLVDEGGDAFLARVPWATDLCHELGLGDQLISPGGRSAFIWSDGKLHPLPSPNVLGIPLDPTAESTLLSDEARAQLAADIARKKPDPLLADDTVGSIVRRRLGDEIFDKLVNPLLGSINAGDMDQLSVHACAPQIASAAASNPSLINGLVTQRSGVDADSPVFHSLPDGLGTLVDALAERYRKKIRVGATVQDITPRRKSLRVGVADADDVNCDAVILATPSFVSSPLCREWPGAAATFLETEYVSVVLVTLAYDPAALEIPEGGSGFLVPRNEQPIITACSWSSSKWPHLARPESTILRVSLGRSGADAVLSARNNDIINTVRRDLSETMGVTADPLSVRVSRWPRSFPQYGVGHGERVEAIRSVLVPAGVYPAGAAVDGIGIPACIKSGRDAAAAALASL